MKLRKTPPTKYAPSMDARYAVPALDKGLDVIELLAPETDGLTLNEIARLLGRTQASCSVWSMRFAAGVISVSRTTAIR